MEVKALRLVINKDGITHFKNPNFPKYTQIFRKPLEDPASLVVTTENWLD